MVTATLPFAELMIGGVYLLGVERRVTALCATGLLLAFLTLSLFHLGVATPPDCNCFGVLDTWLKHENDLKTSTIRTACLTAIAAFGTLTQRLARSS